MKSTLIALAALIILAGSCYSIEQRPIVTADTTWPVVSRLSLTLGSPAALNLGFSYWGNSRIGFRITGGYIPGYRSNHLGGGQVELTYKLTEKRKTVTELSIGGGYEESLIGYESKHWTYGGAFYTLSSRAFFLQLGLAGGEGEFHDLTATLQIGVNLFSHRRK